MEIATVLFSILIMATIVQFLTEIIKQLIPIATVWKLPIPPLISAIVGITLAVVFQVDMFSALGFKTSFALVAWITTGLAISAGSGPMHELIAKLRESRLPIVEIPAGDNEEDIDSVG